MSVIETYVLFRLLDRSIKQLYRKDFDKFRLRRWRKLNPEKRLAQRDREYTKNKDKILARGKRWKNNNAEKCHNNRKQWNASNRDKVRKHQRDGYYRHKNVRLQKSTRYKLQQISTLGRSYIISLIRHEAGLTRHQITPEMIQTKQTQIRIWRTQHLLNVMAAQPALSE